jgi:hypothetical protein
MILALFFCDKIHLNLYEKNSYKSLIRGGVIVITHRQDAK